MATISGVFAAGGTPTDPTTVEVVIWHPVSGSARLQYGTDNEVARLGTGQYVLRWTVVEPGQYRWLWQSTGYVNAAAGGTLYCIPLLPNG